MKKYQVSDGKFLNQVKQWIESDDAIYVDIYVFHAPAYYLIASYEDFEKLISIMEGRGEITVVRHPDCLIRGVANNELLTKAISIVPEGKEWKLLYANSNSGARGSTHQELKDAFMRLDNQHIVINNIGDSFQPGRPPMKNEEVLEAEF